MKWYMWLCDMQLTHWCRSACHVVRKKSRRQVKSSIWHLFASYNPDKVYIVRKESVTAFYICICYFHIVLCFRYLLIPSRVTLSAQVSTCRHTHNLRWKTYRPSKLLQKIIITYCSSEVPKHWKKQHGKIWSSFYSVGCLKNNTAWELPWQWCRPHIKTSP